jgi:L,D-transpeptidase YcbB
VSPALTISRLFNRRQSFALAAWAVLGAGCDSPRSKSQSGALKSDPQNGAAQTGRSQASSGLSDPDARRFYERRGGRPAWTEAEALDLTRSFDEARRHGLNPGAFAIRHGAVDDPHQRDIALTIGAFRYARALAFGFVNPQSIEKIFTLERNQADLAAGLERALGEGKLADWLASLPPSDAEYQALSAAYLATIGAGGLASMPERVARCESVPGQSPSSQNAPDHGAPDQNTPTPKTPTLAAPPQSAPNPGTPGQGVQAPSAPAPGASSPTGPPQTATPQSEPGQTAPAPGAPGPSAAADQAAAAQQASPEDANAGFALSRADRARQLAANLERRRWLNRSPATTRIDVNTASCNVVYLRPGNDPWSARMVCGKIGHETPSIQGSFRRLVTNPAWRVPMDIARREIFPKGGGYLRRENMHVVDGRVVQRPGPRNALGLVKFDVQDPYEIYLHDTPSKSLFALPERHKSHGCVRVQNAVGLARLIAGQNGKADAFDEAMGSGKTSSVDVGQAIPVRLLYHTAFADQTGHVTFVRDIYGWNDRLATALGHGPPMDRVNRAGTDADIGP